MSSHVQLVVFFLVALYPSSNFLMKTFSLEGRKFIGQIRYDLLQGLWREQFEETKCTVTTVTPIRVEYSQQYFSSTARYQPGRTRELIAIFFRRVYDSRASSASVDDLAAFARCRFRTLTVHGVFCRSVCSPLDETWQLWSRMQRANHPRSCSTEEGWRRCDQKCSRVCARIVTSFVQLLYTDIT
jgi:hypothetical protein